MLTSRLAAGIGTDRYPLRTYLAISLMCFASGSLYGFSSIVPGLQHRYGIDLEQASRIFSFAIVAFALAVYAAPRWGRSWSTSAVSLVASFGAALALVGASVASSYVLFLLLFAVGFGAGSGVIYMAALDTSGHTARPTLMTPVMVAVFGAGGAVFGPTQRLLIDEGWGLSVLLIPAGLLIVAGLMLRLSESTAVNHRLDVESTPDVADAGLVTVLWIVFCFGSAAGLMTLGLASEIVGHHPVSDGVSDGGSGGGSGGDSGIVASLALFGVATGNTLGRLTASMIRPVRMLPVAFGVILSGLLAALSTATALVLCLALFVIACGYGIVASAVPSITRVLVGRHRFGGTYSIVFSAWGVAGLTFPWLSGWLFDQTGGFDAAFQLAVMTTLVAFGASLVLSRRKLDQLSSGDVGS